MTFTCAYWFVLIWYESTIFAQMLRKESADQNTNKNFLLKPQTYVKDDMGNAVRQPQSIANVGNKV